MEVDFISDLKMLEKKKKEIWSDFCSELTYTVCLATHAPAAAVAVWKCTMIKLNTWDVDILKLFAEREESWDRGGKEKV